VLLLFVTGCSLGCSYLASVKHVATSVLHFSEAVAISMCFIVKQTQFLVVVES